MEFCLNLSLFLVGYWLVDSFRRLGRPVGDNHVIQIGRQIVCQTGQLQVVYFRDVKERQRKTDVYKDKNNFVLILSFLLLVRLVRVLTGKHHRKTSYIFTVVFAHQTLAIRTSKKNNKIRTKSCLSYIVSQENTKKTVFKSLAYNWLRISLTILELPVSPRLKVPKDLARYLYFYR